MLVRKQVMVRAAQDKHVIVTVKDARASRVARSSD